MIENVLEIKDTYVREVMTPLVDVVAIDSDATLLEFRNLWVKHQYSRLPLFPQILNFSCNLTERLLMFFHLPISASDSGLQSLF
jgi:Mg2+/Co2+ transporter CorC